MQLSRIGEQLPCTREPGKSKDPFAVAVVRLSVTVSPCYRVTTSTNDRSSVRVGPHYLRAAAASDWAWLTRILNPRKLFPRNFVKGQSAKILSLENLALYGTLSSVTFSSKSIPNTNFAQLVHFWQKWHISHPIEQECYFCQLRHNSKLGTSKCAI